MSLRWRHAVSLLALVGLASGCLPTRLNNAAPEDPVLAVDAGEDTDLATDTGPSEDVAVAQPDVKAPDVPALGCANDEQCVAFAQPCATAECDVASGLCKATALADGAPCTDAGDKCVATAVCKGGGCVRTAQGCDDANVCTNDTCDGAVGCSHDPTASFCDDGDACTGPDKCQDAVCTSQPQGCDDTNPCTTDTCDKKQGCTSVAVKAGTKCDDGYKCTDDDACQGSGCAGKPRLCADDGNPCTLENCDKNTGTCSSAAAMLADGNLPCDDDKACTTGDHCDGSACTGATDACDDKNPCTDDACDPATGCAHVNNVKPCSADLCSDAGTCKDGGCSGIAKTCEDGNLCTTDACDLAAGCTHTVADGPCGDGNACTVVDVCAAGACKAGAVDKCDDKDPCTVDSCDAKSGCHNVQALPEAACGTAKECVAGQCVANVCGDGLCGAEEDFSLCAADCPAAGGACEADDEVCITACKQEKCAGSTAACKADADCLGVAKCLAACPSPWCEHGCFLAAGAAPLKLFLTANACSQAFCIEDSWLGKKCAPAAGGYSDCVTGCTSAMCPVQHSACQGDKDCKAVIDCIDTKCLVSNPSCAATCGAANPLFDARVVCTQTYCL